MDGDGRALSRELQGLRQRLLDTGTRNRLIHVNRNNKRANCLNIVNEESDHIHRILRVEGRKMRFKAIEEDAPEEQDELHLAAPEVEEAPVSQERLTDRFLETELGPEQLARRLLKMSGAARTAEEEQGVNVLYLALGFLQWKESASSDMIREAPLLLLPVELVREKRGSTFSVIGRDDDVTANLPLSKRLSADFGVILPGLDEIEAEGWTPSAYFEEVRAAVSGQPGWALDENGMQMGFFSFAKHLMHRDLDPENWPEGTFSDNPLLGGLLTEGFPEGAALFAPGERLDARLDPKDIIQVVDADSSQTRVIEEVRARASLVVQGPPGTGKSQTITNIIAAAAHDGKRVLFVAEKMAALSVVHDRLEKTGLGAICLELHSRQANRKSVLHEIDRTLRARPGQSEGADAQELRGVRDRLNQICDLLHSPLGHTGDTPYGALAEIIRFTGRGTRPLQNLQEGFEGLDGDARAAALNAISRYAEAREGVGGGESHPFRHAGRHDLQPIDLSRLDADIAPAVSALSRLAARAGEIAGVARRAPPQSFAEADALAAALDLLAAPPEGLEDLAETLLEASDSARLSEALDAGARWAEAHRGVEARFVHAAWSAEAERIHQALARGRASWWSRTFGGFRRASGELAALLSGPLPADPDARCALAAELAEAQRLKRVFADDENWLEARLGPRWRGAKTPFAEILAVAKWLDAYRSGAEVTAQALHEALAAVQDPGALADDLRAALDACREAVQAPLARIEFNVAAAFAGKPLEQAPMADLAAALEAMRDGAGAYAEWTGFVRAREALGASAASGLIGDLDSGAITAADAADGFAFACAEARWNAARRARPELDELAQIDRHALVRDFRSLEAAQIEAAKAEILSRHFEQMPRGADGQMKIIRGEIGRKRGHKPIRRLIADAGEMMQRIKPVMLMSPISVAQFLPPDSIDFDLLVIDEASQIRPEDALGVIARARQIVVVGDQKQLPPTSFFDRLVDESDEEEDEDAPAAAGATEMESVLSLCEARGLRGMMLEWHYRSRDPSLIRVSNAEFYNDGLILPPSPLELDEDYGLKFTRVAGVYARGGRGGGRRGTNRIEAEAVAERLAEHARNWPELSVGVVAFSKTQADMLTEVLEMRRREDPVLDAFLREGKHEDVFVKNIENVQGDERDVILISVGYGPQEAGGRLGSMNFGPVNGEGGERRLNVLFTRSRARCEVFASFDPGDIDPSRSARDGPRVLKRFLQFAKTGEIDERRPTGLGADSAFEEDVADVIKSFGYLADPQVGSAGFRIDIGVRHPDRPGQYLAAVECDGATYHSALWARERDRLRQGVLEGMGWRFHRIWSTDWYYNRAREVEKLRDALEAARSRAEEGIRVKGANADAPPDPAEARDEPEAVSAEEEEAIPEIMAPKAPAYVRADFFRSKEEEIHEVPLDTLAELVVEIVEVEGPMHQDEVTRRVATAYSYTRAGRRVNEAVDRAVRAATGSKGPLGREGAFVFTEAQAESPPVRDRSEESGGVVKADYLPPMEILEARRQILHQSGEMPLDEMVRAVARMLGFRRVGPDLSTVIENILRGK